MEGGGGSEGGGGGAELVSGLLMSCDNEQHPLTLSKHGSVDRWRGSLNSHFSSRNLCSERVFYPTSERGRRCVFVYTQEEEDHGAALKQGLSQHVLFMLSGRCLL